MSLNYVLVNLMSSPTISQGVIIKAKKLCANLFALCGVSTNSRKLKHQQLNFKR